MPAYNENGIFSTFFVIFLIVHLYIFQNIILATIIENYKRHLKNEVKSTIKLKRGKIHEAFEFIKDILTELIKKDPIKYKFEITDVVKSPRVSVITSEKFSVLMKLVCPKMSETQIGVLFDILDTDENDLLVFKEFVHLPDLLNYRITEIKDRLNIFETYFPSFYNSEFSNTIKRFVNDRYEIMIML